MKEGQAGIKIGTLSCGNLSGTFSLDPTYVFDSGWSWKNYFEIKGNDLYLKEGYRFDYEGYGLGHNNTLSTWNWGWSNTSLSARFT